jgi:hypothetical protein
MLFNPLSSNYNPTANAQNTGNINFQQNQNQNQLSKEEIEQQAAISRAKRLQRLFEQLNNVLDEAVAATPDSTEAMEMEAAYVQYILARLQGTGDNLVPPEGFGDFATELNNLIDDVVRAWEALLNSEDAFVEIEPGKVFQDLDAVIAILENIATRRMECLMANNWYQQWRTAYRNDMLEDIKESHFAKEQPNLTSQADNMPTQQNIAAQGENNQGNLIRLLQDAVNMKKPGTDTPVLEPVQQEAVQNVLNLLSQQLA